MKYLHLYKNTSSNREMSVRDLFFLLVQPSNLATTAACRAYSETGRRRLSTVAACSSAPLPEDAQRLASLAKASSTRIRSRCGMTTAQSPDSRRTGGGKHRRNDRHQWRRLGSRSTVKQLRHRVDELSGLRHCVYQRVSLRRLQL